MWNRPVLTMIHPGRRARQSRMLALSLVFAIALLAGCGGSDGGNSVAPPVSGIEVTGEVLAPDGLLANVPNTAKPWYASLASLLISESYAQDVTGWSAVSGATVRAFLIDDDGNPIGPALATTTTNPNGTYTLTLPAGTLITSNLIVQAEADPSIDGPVPVGTANTLSGLIGTRTANGYAGLIAPSTEVATRALVARAEPLANFTAQEVVDYVGAFISIVNRHANNTQPPTYTVERITAAYGAQMTAALDAVSGTGENTLVVLASLLKDGSQGVGYSAFNGSGDALWSLGGSGELTWTVIAGAFPDGLWLETEFYSCPSSSCTFAAIWGISTTPGTFEFTVQAVDSSNPPQSATQTFSIRIRPEIMLFGPSALPAGTVGHPYTYSFAPTGGVLPYFFSLGPDSGPLPAGLTLSEAGIISGIPTEQGSFEVIFFLEDSGPADGGSPVQTRSRTTTITIAGPPRLLITGATSLPAGTVGQPYSYAFTNVGGTPPFTWGLSALTNPLPAGLAINAAGIISGIPEAPGTFGFNVEVQDSGDPLQRDIAPFSITIAPPPALSALYLSPFHQAIAIGEAGSQTVRLSAIQATDTTIALSATPAGIVSLPATIQVPALEIAASFEITGLAAGTAQVTAAANGAVSAPANVTVSSQPPAFDLTGIWINEYQCTHSSGSGSATGQGIEVVTQTGVDVTIASPPFFDASGVTGFLGTGTLSGTVMTYSGTSPGEGYTETGTWTRQASDDVLAKASTYVDANGTGQCTGVLQRQPSAPVEKVAAGLNQSFALEPDGTLWAWGYNRTGQLGNGIYQRMLIPTEIGPGWSAVASAVTHTVGLKTDGSLWAWGGNSFGELGDGTTLSRFSPTQIGSATDWGALAVGANHTVAIKTDGTLWAWGRNLTGQLGDATLIDQRNPVQIGTDTNWSAIAAGQGHTVALKTDGTLWAWGSNANGQLGDGTVVNKLSPTPIGAGMSWIAIDAGTRYTVALRGDGTLWAWGENGYGQLGDGTLVGRNSPTQIGTATDWEAIAAGTSDHTLALKTDDTLWAWGLNHRGQLGDGTLINKNAPTQIGTDTSWSAIAVGDVHSIASQFDGSLWAWGYNPYGQHGDGTQIEKPVPTRIPMSETQLPF